MKLGYVIKVHDSRHYSIDDRAGLRNISSSEWQSCYDKYLRDLACPIVSDNDGNSDNADHKVFKDDEDRGGTQEFELISIKFKKYISGLRSIFLFQKKHNFA